MDIKKDAYATTRMGEILDAFYARLKMETDAANAQKDVAKKFAMLRRTKRNRLIMNASYAMALMNFRIDRACKNMSNFENLSQTELLLKEGLKLHNGLIRHDRKQTAVFYNAMMHDYADMERKNAKR